MTKQFSYYYRKLSRLTKAGLILMLVAVMVFTFDLLIHQRSISGLAQRLEIAKTDPIASAIDFQSHQAVAMLRKVELPDTLDFIYQVAKRNKVTLDEITYQYSELTMINAASYELDIPIYGNYLDVRKFLAELLKKPNHAIAINHINLARDDVLSKDLDGMLNLTIYMKN